MLKKLLPAVLVIFISSFAYAQTQYEIIVERPNEKSYKGIISRAILEADTSFSWYSSNFKSYSPDKVAVTALQKNADSIQLVAFMGTWCEDSHFIIPKLFALTDAAGFPNNHITLIGVDREKKTISHLSEALQVTNVPTIIVFKNGKEKGRVVEYGKYGMFDKELGEIINSIQ